MFGEGYGGAWRGIQNKQIFIALKIICILTRKQLEYKNIT